MSQQLINQYLNDIDRIRKFSGSVNEQVIRRAFRHLLDTWATSHKLVFLEELPFETALKTTVYPDGTVLHDIRVPLGYWEAKDTKDDLDEEIRKKFAKGYPQDNIIFENSEVAVLVQNRQEVMRASMTDTDALLRLVTLFFSYERPEIAEFRKAVEQFKADLPAVLDALRARIETAYAENATFRAAAARFLDTCKETINPTLGEADVREMLIQHILTEEIFAHVFNDSDFHRKNNIAHELYELEDKFFTGAVKRETLKGLEAYYAAIRANAAQISSHSEKQTFLKVIYENFYKVYDTKKADRLGVVYTPNEIVKFMIEGADWLCQTHFGRNLVDEHVEILDPATGTGTFICELLEYFRGDPRKLAHKYKNELHANEVAILPYYVANLNIEATYAAITGQFAEFPNLCFVDTLDNVEGLGIRSGHQHDMFAALSDENIERVKRQNARKISVIIGNPPYNANQQNENDNNKNRTYPRVDELIKSSYIRLSTAQKTKVYDMYARFFRWASDRMHDDGVLAFVTNRSFIDSRTFDGFRKAVAEEFNEVYVVDLGGDVRANPKLSGTKHNVFGIQTGVAISFLVKRRKQKGCKIFYARRPEFDTAADKLAFLGAAKLSTMGFERVEPDKKGNWINLTENDWDDFIPVVDKASKGARTASGKRAVFSMFSLGVVTARDQWVYDNDRIHLENKVRYFIQVYESERTRWKATDQSLGTGDWVSREIKWARELERFLRNDTKVEFEERKIRTAAYRPFLKLYTYYDRVLTHCIYQQDSIFPVGTNVQNNVLTFSDPAAQKPWMTLSVVDLPDLHLVGPAAGTVCAPLYRYTADGERVDNITDWGLKQFRAFYGKDGGSPRPEVPPQAASKGEDAISSVSASEPAASPPSAPVGASPPQGGRSKKAAAITKEDIFHYVYGVLHDPVYREKYALNLKRDFPRIPFYPDFRAWADWGRRLMDLHIGYETVEPWPIARTDMPDEGARAAGVSPKTILKADRDNGVIRIDSETTLSGIPKEAFDYRLGNRSGLEWILDQYKEKTPKDPTIREKFNTYRFADYKEHVIDLIARVTRVSVETMEIVEAMKAARR
ncbi:type ISP restriction/modification enzyme [Ciceribacter sp. L1K22]|uniref:type ISP restriction/modification enzyme n=1 Tax=Ciceribacter sp. L1K22 TaxID=2820275 RepID=UPI001ABDFA32|nr:type ISP restriction/modification enzyme [Ciceribacter sp. L1K22]MBO3759524.1 N-6 DNA methylase [Ciceribacter sp. L1K22]